MDHSPVQTYVIPRNRIACPGKDDLLVRFAPVRDLRCDTSPPGRMFVPVPGSQ
jgi:hypothetical protein